MDNQDRRQSILRGSDESDPDDTTIERYLFDKEDFRYMPAKYPIPWPFTQGIVRSQEARQVQSNVESACREVLRQTPLQLEDLKLYRVHRPSGYQDRDVLVALVFNAEYDAAVWKDAAVRLQDIVDSEIKRLGFGISLSVEIRNPRKMSQDRSGIIEIDTPEYHFFRETREELGQVIRANLTGFNSISYHMRGPQNGPKTRPTIVVNIRPMYPRKWEEYVAVVQTELDRLQGDLILNPQRLKFHLELLASSITSCYDDPALRARVLENVTMTPQPGASIGPRGGLECGSMGAYVRARKPDGEVISCFLTCYHVIRGGASGDTLNSNDKNGIGLYGSPTSTAIIVDYPAPRDAAATRKAAFRNVSSSNAELSRSSQEVLDITDYFRNNNGIGRVIHASGYKRLTSKNQRLDWALVALHDDRLLAPNLAVRRNDIPPKELEWLEIHMFPHTSATTCVTSVMKHQELKKYDWFLKGNTRTSPSHAGEVNKLRAEIVWQDPGLQGWTTYEDEIQMGDGGGECFGVIGDSGSTVHNTKYEMCGMMLGNSTSSMMTFVTPFEYILEDIKQSTGLTITLA